MIRFNDIHAFYGKKEILHGLNFELEENKITAVLGKNGSGKSTLVSCMTNSVKYSGDILLDGKSIFQMKPIERAKRIAVLPQLLAGVPLSVGELVAMGRTPYLDIGRRMTNTDREKVRYALEAVGMSDMKNIPVNRLSGGEKQKAYLAVTLAQDTDTVILDEPTTYMDAENQANFMELVAELKTKHKKTVMIVLHDLTKAVETADNILILENGSSAFFGKTEECIEKCMIENVLKVKKSFYEKDGVTMPMFYL